MTSSLFVDLLRRMMRGRCKPLHLIPDGLPAHKELAGKLTVHYLPGYAPDLNPDVLVWSHAKRPGNARRPLQKGEQLTDRSTMQLAEMARNPHSSVRSSDIQVYISAC